MHPQINMPPASLGIWTVRKEAEPLARFLMEQLAGEVVVTPYFALADNRSAFAEVFPSKKAWIFIGTTGIAVRYLDGLMQTKLTDPAVVVLDEASRFAISFLSGHEGGANALAYRVAEITGAVPVITTATEALKPLVLGIGCRKGMSVERIDAAVDYALNAAGVKVGQRLTTSDVREVATVDLKANEPGLREWCAAWKIPVRIFTREILESRGAAWVTKPSEWVRENIGLDGVCEPCALIASPRGTLILPKTALNGVTVAVVRDGGVITCGQ